MTNDQKYFNDVNDWIVEKQYYDYSEIIGLFRNTSITAIIPKLDAEGNYNFYTANHLSNKAEMFIDDVAQISAKFKKKRINVSFNDEEVQITDFNQNNLKTHGIVPNASYKYVDVVNKMEAIKSKLSPNELNALKERVLREASETISEASK